MRVPAIALALVSVLAVREVVSAPLDVPVVAVQRESKPFGPIGVDVRLGGPPAMDVPVAVTITAHADTIDRLVLEVRADDPAALVIGAQSAPVDRDGSRTWVVTVVPSGVSGGNLSVVVSGEIEGVAQAQSVTMGVHPAGAEPSVRALSAVPAQAGSENLSLLPVEERF